MTYRITSSGRMSTIWAMSERAYVVRSTRIRSRSSVVSWGSSGRSAMTANAPLTPVPGCRGHLPPQVDVLADAEVVDRLWEVLPDLGTGGEDL